MSGEDVRLSDVIGSDCRTIDRPEPADGFSNVALEGGGSSERVSFRDPENDPPRKSGKLPKKILHFSDGTLEVYSSSEDEEQDSATDHQQNAVSKASVKIQDPRSLRWIPWMVHYTWWLGSGFIGYCDYLGEKLAWALGITSPKYYYEIEDFKRTQEEDKEKKERMGVEVGKGWSPPPNKDDVIVTSQSNLAQVHEVSSSCDAAAKTQLPPPPPPTDFVDFDPGSDTAQIS